MAKLSDEAFETALVDLQTKMVVTQSWLMAQGAKVLVIFEGRDAAGKDGTIKRMTEYMSARATRVVALPKPSDRERTQWYLQRYAAHLPAAGEVVVMNRSWYNRGGVEPVMGFCSPEEHREFLRDVVPFEAMLVDSGMTVIKLWLDISKAEQKRRLDERRNDPLKTLKISPLDAEAQKRWKAYSEARDQMLAATHNPVTPWTCVRGDQKKPARLAILSHILRRLGCPDIDQPDEPATDLLFGFEPEALKDGRLAR